MTNAFELGLFRFYEHTLQKLVGPPGNIPEDNVEARATRSRKLRTLHKIATGFLTLSTVAISLLTLFLLTAHFTFIGPGNGGCLLSKVNRTGIAKDTVLRLRFEPNADYDDSNEPFTAEYEFARTSAFAALTPDMRAAHLVQVRTNSGLQITIHWVIL